MFCQMVITPFAKCLTSSVLCRFSSITCLTFSKTVTIVSHTVVAVSLLLVMAVDEKEAQLIYYGIDFFTTNTKF